MAAFLQNVDLAANTLTALYSSASGNDTTANIRIVNRTPSTIMVSVAIVNAVDGPTAISNLTPADYFEYEAPIAANDILENSGLAIPPEYTVIVWASSNDVNAVIYGYSQPA